MTTTTVDKASDLSEYVGTTLGTSDWRLVTQQDVDDFGAATGDMQWIHVDVERASAGPFGGTIAHGYMTLSLVIPLFAQILTISNVGMAVNYGLNKVRFPAPLPVGSRVRATADLIAAEPLPDNGIGLTVALIVQCEGQDKPVCVAEALFRYHN